MGEYAIDGDSFFDALEAFMEAKAIFADKPFTHNFKIDHIEFIGDNFLIVHKKRTLH